METNNQSKKEVKRLPPWLQIMICSAILVCVVFWGITAIGKGEYRQTFCEDNFNVGYKERAVFFEDQVKKTFPETDQPHYGCCPMKEGQEVISRSKCELFPEYKDPDLSDKFQYFLQRW